MKEAFYFSHDSNSRSDEKILKLRFKHGWLGYGLYWALIEMLRESSNYELELDLDLISFELRCDKEILNSIISDFSLFLVSGNNFYSPSLKRRMEMKEAKSEQARNAARKRWAKPTQSETDADALRTQSDSNAIKKERKKERKKETSKDSEITIDWTLEKFKTDEANNAWRDWLEFKIAEKEPINRKRQEYVKKDLRKLATINGQVDEQLIEPIISRCIASGWKNLQLTDDMKAKIKQWQAI